MELIYPLKLSYVPVSMIWGGTHLHEKYGKTGNTDKIGETWELSVREKQMCCILNGNLTGMTVREYISLAGNAVVSDSYDGGRFPLLIKFIDATDRLSVQVHPDNIYAAKNENDSGKTEMWYVVDALPGSELIYGIGNGLTHDDFRSAFERGQLDSVLRRVKVKPGDVYFIPAGMLHAIGSGILIAEIQQNCDLTYRVYDYDRLGTDGKPRELHIKKALDVIHPYTEEQIDSIRYSAAGNDDDPSLLAACEYFRVYHFNADLCDPLTFAANRHSFHSLLCLQGSGKLKYGSAQYELNAGECWYIPAGAGEYSMSGRLEFLQIML